jgi:diadenosine tetraphosphate (Ap4A) HIT family hydrolase
MSARCPFCDRGALEDRLILESANFAVIPTKGQIVDGYVLLIPKRHTICFGDLSESEMDEAVMVLERVRTAMTSAYGRAPIVFEHGVIGQTVRHAHLHVVPSPVDLFARIVKDFPDYGRVSTLAAVQETFQREGAYLYYENAAGEKHVFHIFKWPQYLRIVLAEEVGHPERGDWKKMDPLLDAEMMLDTWKKLATALK